MLGTEVQALLYFFVEPQYVNWNNVEWQYDKKDKKVHTADSHVV
jgi:hypothetical protein